MKTEFIETADARWQEIINKSNNEFYQYPAYAQLDAELIDGQALGWWGSYDDNWVLIPFIKRRIPDKITNGKNFFDLISPYGYPGFLNSQGLSGNNLNKLLTKFQDDAWEHRIISSFIRLNPIYNNYLIQENDELKQVIHNRVVLIGLGEHSEGIMGHYKRDHRREVRNLKKKSGLNVIWNDWDYLEKFIEIYNKNMDNVDAGSYYYFSKEYYLNLQKVLKNNVHFVKAVSKEGELAAAALFCDSGEVVQYHLSATSEKFYKHAPIKLVIDSVANKFYKKRMCLNLGGGNNKEDSLFAFKNGFSSLKRRFTTLRIIHSRQWYNNFSQGTEKVNLEDLNGYFPIYRS